MILDLAINHTARNHEWFQSFCQSHADANPDDPYYDYYSWYTGETLPAEARRSGSGTPTSSEP